MIKNIVFDFGNVLLNLDESASYDALYSLLDSTKCEDLYDSVFYPFEKGLISEDSFFNRLQRRSKIVYHPEVYMNAWNAMLGDFPPAREVFLHQLKSHYRLFLLSNTNITHIRKVLQHINTENMIADFENSFFEKTYYSFQMGMRKPDSEIYQFVLNDANLLANETLFIDDKIENVNAAAQLGIHAYHHNPKDEISEIMDDLLVQFSNK
jgi:glucose-1-phosphatase